MEAQFSPTVAGLIELRADDDNVGLAFGDLSWTWREVVAEARVRAGWLSGALDAAHPPHVGVLLPNSPDFVFTLLGAALAGACIVGLNPTRGDTELEQDLRHTECQLLLTDSAQAARLPGALLVEDAPWSGSTALPSREIAPDTLLLLIFTSGSTSAPKAVRRSQGRIAGGANLGFRPTDVLYCAMPLFHGNALSSTLFPALATGARLAVREKFSASQWLPDVRRHGATFANTVGRALGYILATPPSEHDRDHKLRVVLSPEASPRDTDAFAERFGARVLSGYGQSEGGVVLLPSAKRGAMGRPPKGSDLVILDPETGAERDVADIDDNGLLRNGEQAIGELVRRDAGGGFEGYWRNEEAETARTRNGWYWTGDLAYQDSDGDFWFAGRVGEWLRVDSENFAAAPVERVLERYPEFTAVSVVGVPDPQSGDQVLAAVEAATFDPSAFAEFLGSQPDLGAKWAPRFVRLCAALPVTGNEKVDRRRIAREAWCGGEDVWWRPPREAAYRLMTDEDRQQLQAEFASHGRAGAHPHTSTPA